MLTRSLFIFATLSLIVASATAQDMPAKLVPLLKGPLVGKYAAKGVQIYICNVKGGASEWDFKAPEADLIDAQGFAKNYAGPTWEAFDGSKIVGKILASEPALSGSTSGMWKRSHGRTTKAPPDERGGNRYVRPKTTAPHLDLYECAAVKGYFR